MTVHDLYASQRTAARVAGLAALVSTALIAFAHYGINFRLMVPGDAAATARNILAHEGLFRINIACDVLYGIGNIVLLTALFALLEPVHRTLAGFAAILRLVYAITWLVSASSLYVALRLLHSQAYVHTIPTDQMQTLARLVLGTGFEAYYIGLPFYALAATVVGVLLYRSRYIPRALAAIGVVSAAFGVLCAFAFILVPGFGKAVDPYWYDSALGISEVAISLWLLIRGIRPTAMAASAPARGAA